MYAAHNAGTPAGANRRRSNVEYGLIAATHGAHGPYGAVAKQGVVSSTPIDSSFDSRMPNPGSNQANYSNVQIVCRINGPNKVQGVSKASAAAALIKRPNSASRIHFMASGGGP